MGEGGLGRVMLPKQRRFSSSSSYLGVSDGWWLGIKKSLKSGQVSGPSKGLEIGRLGSVSGVLIHTLQSNSYTSNLR